MFRATFFRRVSTLWLPILLRLRLRLSVLLWCTVNAKIIGRFSPFLMSAIGH
ncbi:hypothetical protein ECP03023081_1251 [Escherichia coli P0302308.1]|nr:hypothetical protein ECP03023081_1251 [Escherichia coli P0302308.1]